MVTTIYKHPDSTSGESTDSFNAKKRSRYSEFIVIVKLIMYILLVSVAMSYCYDVFFTLHSNSTVCFWNFICLVSSLFFTVIMWDEYIDKNKEKVNTLEINVVYMLLSLFLIIPGITMGNPWISFVITNALTRPLEYPLVAGSHMVLYMLASRYSNTSLQAILNVLPGVLALASIVEYEISLFYKKKIAISKYKISITGILTVISLLFCLGLIFFRKDVVKTSSVLG